MEIVGEAVLEKVIGELIKPIFDGGKKAAAFGEILKRVKSILKLIEPTVHQIKQSSGERDGPKEESEKQLIQRYEEGKKLIQNHYRAHWLFKKRKYEGKITAFYESLILLFKFRMPLEQFNTIRKILALLQSQLKSGTGEVSGQIGYLGSGDCYAPEPPAFTVGLDVPLREVKELLFKESVVVVSAPGGCGKTTLVQKLCQDPYVKGKFKDNIFFVTVSKVPNIKLMVRKLFEHNHRPVPEFQTDEDAIKELKRLLTEQAEKAPVLLVLDDVWGGPDIRVEPKFPLQKFKEFEIPEFRILVTSRYKFRSFGSAYKLDLLHGEEAMTLFRQSAFPTDGDFTLDEDFDEDIVKEIVKRCGGFPLALQVVGRSLCGLPVEIWESTLLEWSEGQSILESGEGLLDCLQSSLASLNDKLEECFMDLGSFPEDKKIPVTALIDMWAELYKPDKYKPDKNGVHASSRLIKLSLQNLLKLVVTRKGATEVEGCYDDAFVLQHDLLRELAIRQSSQEPMEERKRLILDLSGNKLPDWWTEGKQPCIKARLLSISTDEMFSSSWCDMQAPEVEVLILNFQTRDNNYTLPEFMKRMDKLKVLVLTNYGFSIPELTNFSVLGSLSSLKRIRLERVSIPALCNTMVELKNLEKITLVMCKINQAFNSSAIQMPVMLPNLKEINIDSCNDLVGLPEWLCDLVQLRKLSISNCHKPSTLPEGMGRLGNLEVLRLHACTKLVGLPDSIASLHNLTFLDISGCFRMRELPKQMGELCRLRKLYMRRCSRLRDLPPSIMRIKQLKVICDTEKAHLWEDHNFTNLTIDETTDLDWLV
ncbi:probable disease resistance protein At5g66900 [Vitis riparia]|uniref:probable disease resistance protein At5g66900 n=1 Tax=Vitis riparia TaxID=96939 RepID=UPI00155A1977|nr:probable disease resistance protein At5g66900 [Vitis riparia]